MWDEAPETDELDSPAHPDDEERVLVVVVTRQRDWELVRNEHWYRIPMSRAPKRLGAEYLAFYHTKGFGELRWTIAYYAPIMTYRLVRRIELFPDEPAHPRASQLYYRVEIGPLVTLPRPIPSLRLRRIAFISTTLSRLLVAREVNDLWPRETARDQLWRALRAREIPAHRNYAIKEGQLYYQADLAVFCARRNLAIECVEGLFGAERSASPGTKEETAPSPGWATQRFEVSEVMSDISACVEVVRGFVAANGGTTDPWREERPTSVNRSL